MRGVTSFLMFVCPCLLVRMGDGAWVAGWAVWLTAAVPGELMLMLTLDRLQYRQPNN